MLTPAEIDAIKDRRALINATLERNGEAREGRFLHGISTSFSFFNTLLSVSLGVGAAIVPLVLLGKDLSYENSVFLKCASGVLIGNAVFLLIGMKNMGESISIYSLAHGLKERLILLRLRNLLTKSILTKDPQYFHLFNISSREVAREIVNGNQRGPSLSYQTDTGLYFLVVGLLLAVRPIVPLERNLYLVGCVIILYLLLVYIFKLVLAQRTYVKNSDDINTELGKEEKDINDFIDELAKRTHPQAET